VRLASVVAAAAGALLAQTDGGPSAPADGAQAGQRVRITVRSICATNDPSAPAGLDVKLAPIATHLESFGEQFRFRSYQLLQVETVDLDWKAGAQIEIPGSRSLQLTPRQLEPDGKIKVHLELLGEHPTHSRKLHTDYAIQRGGTILVGGLRVNPDDEKSGKLLIAITQETEK
jgi:hypothetical protein